MRNSKRERSLPQLANDQTTRGEEHATRAAGHRAVSHCVFVCALVAAFTLHTYRQSLSLNGFNPKLLHDNGGRVSSLSFLLPCEPTCLHANPDTGNDNATTLCAVVACSSTAAGLDVVFASSQQSIANAMTQTPLNSHTLQPPPNSVTAHSPLCQARTRLCPPPLLCRTTFARVCASYVPSPTSRMH